MTMILTNPRERSRFMRFALVGVVGAIVDFGTFNLVTSLTPIPAIFAQGLSFTVAIISNFLWNRFWTYPDSRSKAVSQQIVQFTAVSIIGLAIRTPLFAVLENPLSRLFQNLHLLGFFEPVFLGHNMALAIAVIVVMFWNFFVNRFWTYGDVD
jgi:putative flippase GtrA